ncbi:thioredoxin domain-containing protein [Deinococcus sp. QL22]|uniref:DsbA family protein n=1 Tax=Deinococcus sp. QL22 TaxID=2939437 RepID=UPI0020179518|nr:thioredoxin domain-containing protein [Deinococcus sp. QL22]UQN10619.1 DsbA family protein [Deinococcus sp. QL22]
MRSVSPLTILNRAQLGLLLIMVGNILYSCGASAEQFVAGRNSLGLVWLLQVGFAVAAAHFTRQWIIATATSELGKLEQIAQSAISVWNIYAYSPVFMAIALVIASNIDQPAAPLFPLVNVIVPFGILFALVRTFTQTVSRWIEQRTQVLRGGSEPEQNSTALLQKWLTALAVLHGLTVLTLFNSFDPTAIHTQVEIINNVLTSVYGALGLTGILGVKRAVALIGARTAEAHGEPVSAWTIPPQSSKRRSKGWTIVLSSVAALLLAAVFGLVVLGQKVQAEERPGSLGLPTSVTANGEQIYGHPDAPITVTEYADFQCPGCQWFATSERHRFLKSEIRSGKVKVVFADFPLAFHNNAVPAAIAARCAAKVEQFWVYHDALYVEQDKWARMDDPSSFFLRLARRLKVPEKDFLECLHNPTTLTQVERSVKRGEALDLPGTPSFAVNGKVVPWKEDGDVQDTLTSVEQVVHSLLERGSNGP